MPDPATLTLFVDDLHVSARIGVHAHERGKVRPLLLSAELGIEPPTRDAIEATIDYDEIARVAHVALADEHIDLVEEVASRIGALLLAYPRVLWVRLRVSKPGAVLSARSAGAIWYASK